MKEIKARLIQRIKRTPTVESFRFLPEEKLNFIPGQFTRLIFDGENRENKELNKYLSFSCSPGKEYVEVTKRLSSSAFSSRLKGLKIGGEVSLAPPSGNCIFKDDYKNIGFLIGGIGITPVISIIEHVINRKLETDIVLVYSNRTDEEIAFKQELDRWRSLNDKLKIFYMVTDCEPKDNTCIHGMITKDLVKEKICDMNKRIFFIFGPAGMVEAMKVLSFELGCDKESVKSETFVGY
ncbi:MAG: FAD-dependent oxidoreductase [Candidatus Omnitrophica bacterium]|nr:FAD-dependent oxidoreductase [Candidatus Omnitrophota bacterium]